MRAQTNPQWTTTSNKDIMFLRSFVARCVSILINISSTFPSGLRREARRFLLASSTGDVKRQPLIISTTIEIVWAVLTDRRRRTFFSRRCAADRQSWSLLCERPKYCLFSSLQLKSKPEMSNFDTKPLSLTALLALCQTFLIFPRMKDMIRKIQFINDVRSTIECVCWQHKWTQ